MRLKMGLCIFCGSSSNQNKTRPQQKVAKTIMIFNISTKQRHFKAGFHSKQLVFAILQHKISSPYFSGLNWYFYSSWCDK